MALVTLTACGGGGGAPTPVTPPNPAPSISSLSPDSITAGETDFILTVNGSGFITTSIVRWNGANRATTFLSSTQLTANILATDIATDGTAQVTVFNPAPGGGTSNALTFTITVPPLIITTTQLPDASGGQFYDFTLASDGGTPPITWSLAAGSGPLPTTLTLDSATGQISGTVDPVGTDTLFPITVEATDAASPPQTAMQDLSIRVLAGRGTIQGQILFSDGLTPAQGFNVIARQVDDPMTTEDESRRIAVSSVSGFLFTADAGNPVVSGPGSPSPFGSRDQTLIGFYQIPGLPPGDYTVEVEAIDPFFTLGRRVGPIGELGFQFPLPLGSTPEFYNGAGETGTAATDDPAVSVALTVNPGDLLTNIDIILNDTAPRFDIFETEGARNDTCPTNATPITNETKRASLSPYADIDVYSFQGTMDALVTIETFAQRLELDGDPLTRDSFADTVVELLDSSCTLLTFNDDIDPGIIQDSRIENFTLPSDGTFFIRVRDFRGDGRPDLIYDLSLSGAN